MKDRAMCTAGDLRAGFIVDVSFAEERGHYSAGRPVVMETASHVSMVLAYVGSSLFWILSTISTFHFCLWWRHLPVERMWS